MPGPKRVVAFLSPRPTVIETPLPNVALVFFAGPERAERFDRRRELDLARDGRRLGRVDRRLAARRSADREVLLDLDAGVLGVGVERRLLVAGDFDRAGVCACPP